MDCQSLGQWWVTQWWCWWTLLQLQADERSGAQKRQARQWRADVATVIEAVVNALQGQNQNQTEEEEGWWEWHSESRRRVPIRLLLPVILLWWRSHCPCHCVCDSCDSGSGSCDSCGCGNASCSRNPKPRCSCSCCRRASSSSWVPHMPHGNQCQWQSGAHLFSVYTRSFSQTLRPPCSGPEWTEVPCLSHLDLINWFLVGVIDLHFWFFLQFDLICIFQFSSSICIFEFSLARCGPHQGRLCGHDGVCGRSTCGRFGCRGICSPSVFLTHGSCSPHLCLCLFSALPTAKPKKNDLADNAPICHLGGSVRSKSWLGLLKAVQERSGGSKCISNQQKILVQYRLQMQTMHTH